MFTVGIFSTHIPYIAFVFFYAFFFLFGYQKIAEEEIPTEEKFTLNELTITTETHFSDNNGSFDFDAFHMNNIPKNGRMFCVDRQAKFRITSNEQIQSGIIVFSNFSRPPPAVCFLR